MTTEEPPPPVARSQAGVPPRPEDDLPEVPGEGPRQALRLGRGPGRRPGPAPGRRLRRTFAPRRPWLVPAAAGALVLVVAVVAWRLTGGAPEGRDPPDPSSPFVSTAGPRPGRAVPRGASQSARRAGRRRAALGAVSNRGRRRRLSAPGLPDAGIGYAASRTGVYRTSDGGQSWTRPAERGLWQGVLSELHRRRMSGGWAPTGSIARPTEQRAGPPWPFRATRS